MHITVANIRASIGVTPTSGRIDTHEYVLPYAYTRIFSRLPFLNFGLHRICQESEEEDKNQRKQSNRERDIPRLGTTIETVESCR